MTKEQFSRLGRELFGARGWQSKIADAWAVHRSTVHRWGEGTIPIPDDVPAWLNEEAVHKIATIKALARV